MCAVRDFVRRDVVRKFGGSTDVLAPPAERQRSFSNAELSVVVRRRRPSFVVNFSLNIFISQKLFNNFFSSLACSFIRKVSMYCKNVDLVESS